MVGIQCGHIMWLSDGHGSSACLCSEMSAIPTVPTADPQVLLNTGNSRIFASTAIWLYFKKGQLASQTKGHTEKIQEHEGRRLCGPADGRTNQL